MSKKYIDHLNKSFCTASTMIKCVICYHFHEESTGTRNFFISRTMSYFPICAEKLLLKHLIVMKICGHTQTMEQFCHCGRHNFTISKQLNLYYFDFEQTFQSSKRNKYDVLFINININLLLNSNTALVVNVVCPR